MEFREHLDLDPEERVIAQGYPLYVAYADVSLGRDHLLTTAVDNVLPVIGWVVCRCRKTKKRPSGDESVFMCSELVPLIPDTAAPVGGCTRICFDAGQISGLGSTPEEAAQVAAATAEAVFEGWEAEWEAEEAKKTA